MADNVVVIQEENTTAVVDSTAALVSVVSEENNIAVVTVELENQVVIQQDNDIVIVESSAKGEKGDKGDKGDPADLTPEVINPIIDGRITSITNTVEQIDSKIAAATNNQQVLWTSAVDAAKSEVSSNLALGLSALQSELDSLDTSVQIDLTNYNNQLNSAIDAAKSQLQAANLNLDDKFTQLTNTINLELSNIDTELGNIVFDINQFNTDLGSTNTLLNSTLTDYAQFKTLTNNSIGTINNAVFMIDPNTGQVITTAYHYTNEKFNEASIRMNGIDGSITLLTNNLSAESGRITSANSQISLLQGQITLKASYTEMNEAIAGAISAVTPAYSFGFFNSTEGWSAVNGSITNTINKVSLVQGDITNQALSYSADDNPSISLTITRTAGSGWVGDMYITYSGGSTVHYPAVFNDVPTGAAFSRILNLSEVGTYTGTVTGIRFVFGATNADTFDLDDITIGKPSAAITQLEGIQGQINQLGIDLDAVEGSLTNYVTVTTFNANAVTLSNVATVLDGVNSIISLKATQTALNNNGTISKANSASSWVDAANANITNAITTFNAQPNGVDSKLSTLTGNYNQLRTEMDAATGTIGSSIVSIHNLKLDVSDVQKAGIYAQLKMKQLQDNALAIGDSVAVAQQKLTALSTEQSALAQQLLQLNASYGSYIGQLNSQIINLSKALADADSATALQINQVNANLSDKIDANYQTLIQSIADANQATVNAGEQIKAEFNLSIKAVDENLRTLIANQNFASVESVDLVRAELNNDYASKEYLLKAITDLNKSLIEEVTELEAKIDVNSVAVNSELDSVRKLVVDNNSALASTIDSLAVQFGANSSSLLAQINELKASSEQTSVNLVSMLEAKFSNNLASKQELTQAIADERQASLLDISTLSASVASTYATKTSVTDAVATETNARITAISNLSTNVGNTYATKSELTTAIANERTASVNDINTLNANVANTYSTKTETTALIATETNARTTAISNLVANIGATYATITSMNDAIASETAARISALNTLTTNIGNTYATISSLNQAISDEVSARIAYVDSKQASYDGRYASITRVDSIESTVNVNKASAETSIFATNSKANSTAKTTIRTLLDLDKQRKGLMEQGDLIAIGQRQIAVEVSDKALAQEKAELVAAIGRLEVQANSNFTQVNKAIADESTNRVSALTTLETSIGNKITAATTRLDSVETTTSGLVTSVNGVQSRIEDPEKGLTALLTNVQSAQAKADQGVSSVNTILAQLNDPLTGLGAVYGLQQNALIDIYGLSQSYTQLSNRVSTAENNNTSAFLQLSAVSDKVNGLQAKAFLGVSNVVGGKATVNGIEINGSTNTILFQADTFGLVDTAGNQQLYFNAIKQKWEFKGDLVAGTYQTATSGMRVEITGDGDLIIWAGSGDKTKENAVFYVDKTGVVKAKNMQLESAEVTTPTIRNARLDFVGSQYLRVEAAEPFGPHSLISWFGKIVDGINYDSATKNPIYSGMVKSNAITFLSSKGEAYFGGSILAGTLRNAAQSTSQVSNTYVEVGPYTSNGGLITIKCSFSASSSFTGSGTCPVKSNPTATLILYKWDGSAYIQVASQVLNGNYECTYETGTHYANEMISGSFTYTDNGMNTNSRKYKLSVVHTVTVNAGMLLNLSLISEE